MFADQQTLDTAFDVAINQNWKLFQCPGIGIDSPTTWHYSETPNRVEGRIACGTYKNLVWSKNSDLLIVEAQNPNMDELHKWWPKFS